MARVPGRLPQSSSHLGHSITAILADILAAIKVIEFSLVVFARRPQRSNCRPSRALGSKFIRATRGDRLPPNADFVHSGYKEGYTMSTEEPENSEPETTSSRIYDIFRVLVSSVLISLLLAGISTSALKLWDRLYPKDVVKVWQVSEGDYQRISTALKNSNTNLVRLKELVANNPEAVKLATTMQEELQAANTSIANSPFIEQRDTMSVTWNLISSAYAKGETTDNDGKGDSTITYILLALVAFVTVFLCVVYAFCKDKSQRAFIEKTLTTIVGFALGMITGSNTGRLR